MLVTDALIDAGADFVISNHAHTALRAERRGGSFVAHALGNFCFTPRVGFYNDSCQADYSITLNCFFDAESKKLVKTTFAVLKNVTLENGISVVRKPVEADAVDVEAVCKRVTGRTDNFKFETEYSL